MTSLTAVINSTMTNGISVVYLDVGDTSGICYIPGKNVSKTWFQIMRSLLLTCLDAGDEQEENVGSLAEFDVQKYGQKRDNIVLCGGYPVAHKLLLEITFWIIDVNESGRQIALLLPTPKRQFGPIETFASSSSSFCR